MKKESKTTKKKIQELIATLQRLQADFENYRKRIETEKKTWTQQALEDFVSQLLPILDNFERATQHIPPAQKNQPWVEGIFYIKRQLEGVLTSIGVAPIPCQSGDKFDPHLHEAIGVTKTGKVKKGHISKIELPGYRFGEKIIRPVKVIVKK